MKNSIHLIEISVKEHKVDYQYEIAGEETFCNYFRPDVPFQIEYDISIEDVPVSVLAVPFVGNMLGLALIFDAEIIVPELDEDFYHGIPSILDGFAKMYAGKLLGGSVQSKIIKKNVPPVGPVGGSLLFYGGGVDSAYSLIQHHQVEKVTLFHIWGADISYGNTLAWENAYAVTQRVCEQFDITNHIARANLHLFFKEGLIDGYIQPIYHDNYWHGFQHGVGMQSIAAPLAWQFGYTKCIFASTYSTKDQSGEYICGSDPTIDNFVQFSGCQVDHDGFNLTRQDKIHQIGLHAVEHGSIPLRVCFSSMDGKNCNSCEKCTRTAFALFVEGLDCNCFGLSYDIESLSFKFNLAAAEYLSDSRVSVYRSMQQAFQRNFRSEDVPKGLLAFYTLPFEEFTAIAGASINIKKRYNDLKSWTDQLQEGKNWLEQHSLEQESYIKDLEKRLHITELEVSALKEDKAIRKTSSFKSVLNFVTRKLRKHQ